MITKNIKYLSQVLNLDLILSDAFFKDSEIKRADLERQIITADRLVEMIFKDREAGLAILGDEVGMGKTYVALMVVSYFLSVDKKRKQVLLITPDSSILQSKWEREIHEFSEKYLKDSKKVKLRPLVVRDFPHLIESMIEPGRITLDGISKKDAKFQTFAWYFEVWLRETQKGKIAKNFQFYNTMWWEFEDGLRYISESAVREFLNYEKTHSKEFTRDLRKLERSPEAVAKKYYELFIKEQKSYLPNILLVRTGHLKPNLKTSKFLMLQVMRELLYKKHSSSKNEILKIFADKLPSPKDYFQERKTAGFYEHLLETNDIWGIFEGDFPLIEKDKNLKKIWNEFTDWWEPTIRRKFEAGELVKDSTKNLKEFMSAVIKARFERSHFGFCIVDEVHNWKEKNNNAGFCNDYLKEAIPFKLLMSATPFQINPEELNNILDVTHHSADGVTSTVRETLFKENDRGVVRDAIRTSKTFYQSWENLGRDELKELNSILPNGLENLISQTTFTTNLKPFVDSIINYKKSQDRLKANLSKIFIRHTKETGYRHFHAGQFFDSSAGDSAMTSLYETKGKTTTDDGYALFEFVCMRADQLLRSQKDQSAYAHLLNGMTSSFGAYQESLEKKQKSINKMSEDAQTYLGMVTNVVSKKQFEHSKVKATVERAIENWSKGKKTLIFCYRVKTVEEITRLLESRIDERLGRVKGKITKQQFKDFAFSRDRVWFSILNCMGLESEQLLNETFKFMEKQEFNFAVSDLVKDQSKSKANKQKIVYEAIDSLLLKEFLPRLKNQSSRFIIALQDLCEEIETEELFLSKLECHNLSLGGADSDDNDSGSDHSVMIKHYRDMHFWTDITNDNYVRLHQEIFKFLDTELNDAMELPELLQIRHDLMAGLSKIAFRKDVIARMVENEELTKESVKSAFFGHKLVMFSIGDKLIDYLKSLKRLSGSISSTSIQVSKRKSLWNVMRIQDTKDSSTYVAKLDGSVTKQTRENICQAFNSPLLPDILVCTSIGQEGIDLHLYCDDVIHHDIPWNPAILEQRTGRIDRVNSLTERLKSKLCVGIPFLGNGYEQFQYDVLLERAHRFSILMGDEVTKKVLEEFHLDQENESLVSEDGSDKAGEADVKVQVQKDLRILPLEIVNYLEMKFSVAK